MATKSQADQLAVRLRGVRAQADEIRKQLAGLEEQERRLTLALEVLAEEFGGKAASAARAKLLPKADAIPEKSRSVEQVLLEHVFAQRDGLTSAEVVEMVAPYVETPYGTVITTLSRMVAKGLLRRDGRQVFLTPKGRKP